MQIKALSAACLALALSACVSIGAGGDPPESLLTLTPASSAPAGAGTDGDMATALSVTLPSVPQRLNAVRVPVKVSDSSLAYLQDAFWVEKPAALFQRLVAETIRARGSRLVVGGGELEYAAQTQLAGDLVAMDYDASRGEVVVIYDAVLRLPDGNVRTQRFESTASAAPDAASVGPALNRAANDVATQVADWVG